MSNFENSPFKSNKHTNVIFTNVPLRYDLSYYSQINEKTREYDKRLGEIIHEHEQVTLLELVTERRNHMRHGLHFNKLGKWWLSHKITKSIYTILSVETEQGRKMGKKQGSQENKNKVKRNNLTQGYMDHTKKEVVRIVTHIEVDNMNTERLSQESKESESVSENVNNKKVDDRGKQDNEKVVVQNQVCGGGKNSAIRNNSTDPEGAKISRTNIQDKNLDKAIETRRISTRSKKNPKYEG
jgi:hypothetical protein